LADILDELANEIPIGAAHRFAANALRENKLPTSETRILLAGMLDEFNESMPAGVGHPREDHYRWLGMFWEKQQELKAQGVRDHAKRAYKHVAGQVHVEADTVKRTINKKFSRVPKLLRKKGR
jgi:hypothetical protein